MKCSIVIRGYFTHLLIFDWQMRMKHSSALNKQTASPRPILMLTILIFPWSHQMETFSALLAICAGKSPVPGEFPAQRPVTRSFDVIFDLRLNNCWVNNREAGDLRHYRAHYDVTVMLPDLVIIQFIEFEWHMYILEIICARLQSYPSLRMDQCFINVLHFAMTVR